MIDFFYLFFFQQKLNKKEIDTDPDNSSDEEKKERPTSVKEYGVSFDQNIKHRRKMEDSHLLVDGFDGKPYQGLFCVFDGHGGKEAASYAEKHFGRVLSEVLKKEKDAYSNPKKMEECFATAYKNIDNEMEEKVQKHHGCTAVTSLITENGGKRYLYTANAGDASAVLCHGGEGILLSVEHKASVEEEVKRIQDKGGFIVNGRVNGQIIITRSLGDWLMKDYIISTPYFDHRELTDKDTHLIVACDGLWDVCQPQEACDFIAEYPKASADELSKRLLVKALQDGSTDNLSICVVKL